MAQVRVVSRLWIISIPWLELAPVLGFGLGIELETGLVLH